MSAHKPFPISRLAALALLAMAATTSKASAHSVEAPRAFHGGIAQAAGGLHLELLVEDGRTILYVYDRQNHPLPLDGAIATALLWLETGSLSLDLVRDGRALAATASFAAHAVHRVTLDLRVPGRDPVSAWFSAPTELSKPPERGGSP